jgi:murein DD-endopeptidase MepM/ murein hydrolase activator NlpD
MACGILLGASPGFTDDINKQVAQAEDDLARADAKVAAAIDRLQTAKEKLPAARSELAAALDELTAAQQRKAAADLKVARAIAKVTKAKQEIAETEQQIAYLEQQIGRMAREVYQNGSVSEVEILLDAQSPGDFASRLETLRSIAQGNNSALSDLDAAKAQLTLRLAGLKQAEQEAEAAQAQAQQEVEAATAAKQRADAAKATIDELVSDRASALRDAKERKADVKKQYEQYKAEQERIAAIARAAAAKAQGGRTAGVPLQIGTGGLAWPTPGAGVSGNVGPRIHPVYGYRSCHTGTDISASGGTAIRAAASGVVVSVQNGGPYGLHTLIQHGSGISTMYAHQASVAVSPGQRVKQGDVIGTVGSTGWSTGPHLHFEVHVNGTPYDPMGWFGGAKVPVRC